MSTLPAVTMQDLELEHAELLPSRETLCSWHSHGGGGNVFQSVATGNSIAIRERGTGGGSTAG